MRYQEALNFIFGLTDYEKAPASLYSRERFDLARMGELLSALGNPHLKLPALHIAGTKGKGSTAKMISSVLEAAGYRVGLFTSPHLHDFRERIAVNEQPIPMEEVAWWVELIEPIASRIPSSFGPLSTFEVMTALAFSYFVASHVDIQVLEVGMGGRLDATNVVQALVSVITSISLDHTEVLGHSIGEIAREKAGIVKEDGLVVCSPQRPEAAAIIEEVCRERGVHLIRVGQDVTWKALEQSLEGQAFSYKGLLDEYRLWIPLLGQHQIENASAALAALEALSLRGWSIPKDSITRGMGQARWPGRLEVLRRSPFLVVDGAHNVDSAHRLREAICSLFDSRRVVLLFGASADKDIPGMAEELASLSDTVIVARSQHPRAAEPEAVAKEFLAWGAIPQVISEVPLALAQAMEMAGGDDLILVTGSLFLVAEVREALGYASPSQEKLERRVP